MKMRDIMPEHVRQWVTRMKDKGASPGPSSTARARSSTRSSPPRWTDGVVTVHPSHGVKIPPAPEKPRRIITAAQFDRLYQALPNADAQLLVETEIESGLRWGELTELRVLDLDFETCILTVSRAVVELTQDEHPDGGRFLVKDYPKDKEYRRFKLSGRSPPRSMAHIAATGSAAMTCSSPTGRQASPRPGAPVIGASSPRE